MRDVGDRHPECVVLNDLGRTLRLSGEIDQATERHRQALALAERGNYLFRRADAHAELGYCLLERGPAEARQHWQAALVLYRQLDLPHQHDIEAILRGRVGHSVENKVSPPQRTAETAAPASS
jgi:hypothetical protein